MTKELLTEILEFTKKQGKFYYNIRTKC